MKLSKARVFLIFSICFIVGVGLRSLVAVPMTLIVVLVAGGIVLAILFWRRSWRVLAMGLLFIALGIVRYELSIPVVDPGRIEFYNGDLVTFSGVVDVEPDTRADHVKLTMETKQMLDAGQWREIHGRVLVTAALYPTYSYGDVLRIECDLRKPERIENFAYDQYLARYDIYALCSKPKITFMAANQGSAIFALLLRVKTRFVSIIQQSLPEPHAAFLGGLILGARKAIPPDLTEAFNRTGTSHIVALSGYNISIIGVLILNLCKALWIPRKRSFWIALCAILFFILITGAPASVVRAGIMGMLVLLARQLGRASRITNTLALAALCMVLINPKVLVFDAGFQLSFLATIGLVYLSPLLEAFTKKLPEAFAIRQNASATLSATLMTLPFIIVTFERISLLALPTNLLILPAVPIAMIAGFILGAVGLVWMPLAQLIGSFAWIILQYVLTVIEFFAHVPWASFHVASGQSRWVLLFYVPVFFALFILTKRKHPLRPKRTEDVYA